MTLSVIVPVYNAEKYLDECVRSILNQTFDDFEVILVNDGSTDSSAALCDSWVKQDSRVRVIHKNNGGPSEARQTGIAAATGEFIAFVDSDDKIDEDMYRTMLSAQKRNDYDYVICGLKRFFDDKDDVRFEPAGDFTAENPEEIMAKLIMPMIYPLDNDTFTSSSSTKILFRKRIFADNNIFYRSLDEYFSEDLLLNVEYLLSCRNAISIPDTFYSYRANLESFTHTIRTDDSKLQTISNMYFFVLDLFRSEPRIKTRISIKCLELLSVYLRHLVKNNGFKASLSQLKRICARDDIQTMMDFDYPQLSLKNKLMKFLISGKYNIMLTMLIAIYNKVYIQR